MCESFQIFYPFRYWEYILRASFQFRNLERQRLRAARELSPRAFLKFIAYRMYVSTTTIRGFVIVSECLFLFMFQVAAENAFMNPMMDPRFAAMWGMPGTLDDPQWQQFYQRMQQEQHKQLLEQSKQEFLMGKQGAPFPLASYPFFFGDKRLEQKRKVTGNVYFLYYIAYICWFGLSEVGSAVCTLSG